jgi:hypothetical protein
MFQSMARSLDSNAVLISTLAVIRNLSFEVDSAELFDCYVFAYIFLSISVYDHSRNIFLI